MSDSATKKIENANLTETITRMQLEAKVQQNKSTAMEEMIQYLNDTVCIEMTCIERRFSFKGTGNFKERERAEGL